MDPKWYLLEAIFQKECKIGKVCLDCAGVYGLHMGPSRGALRATNISKKERDIFQNRSFLANISEIYEKDELQKVSKWASLFRGWRLLGHLCHPLVPQSVF